jgi:L-ribulose-5-phosphate 3-epimerase
MNRRDFLNGTLGAAVTTPFLADLLAQGPLTPTPAPAAAPVTRRLVLDANSRHLQWLRTPDEIADATVEMVCGGVCVNIGPAPAHVDPARVAQQLPPFVNRIRSRGLRVVQIKGPAITDATQANAEAIIGAASQSGITHYSLGHYTYDLTKPLQPQIDAVKARLDRFVRLNQKHNTKLVLDTLAGPDAIGGVVLDLLPVFKEFDPRYVGFRWDTGNMALHADGMWETLMRLAGPYVAAIGWRDRGWVQDLGLKGEGGPYAGPYPRVDPLVTLPDGSAVPGPAARLGLTAPATLGRGGRGAAAASDEDGTPAPAQAARGGGDGGGAGRGGGGGRAGGAPRGPANSAGAGSIDDSNPLYKSTDGSMPKRPIGGQNAKGGGWSAPDTAMGTGVVHLPAVASVLADIGFNGPSVLHSEYRGIGGAETGLDRIDRPRQWVIGMLKRDVITIRKSFEMANRGLAI